VAEKGIQQRQSTAREYVRELDKALHELWNLGRNLILGWAPRERGLDVLVIPHHRLTELQWFDRDILGRSLRLNHETLDRAAAFFRTGVVQLPLSFTPGKESIGAAAIDRIARRYSVTHAHHRAGILIDIVGFSLYSPLEQVAVLNNLAYSINVAHHRALANDVKIDLSRTTTGDGFYVWNRDDGLTADVNLFYVLMLILADNAIAQAKAAITAKKRKVRSTQPVLRTAFHLGSHYEYFLTDALNPSLNSFIVGDLTIELARMVAKALPNQILIGNFTRPTSESAAGTSTALDVSTPLFVAQAQKKLETFENVVLSGEKITAINAYLTGDRIADGYFNIKRYVVHDKHGLTRDVFNAKVNIHRGDAKPIFLGLQEAALSAFDAEGKEYVPENREQRMQTTRYGTVISEPVARSK
tara:strand:- start:632 stop:1873 length:1242 start_codon:yes stop_codon:yes gene_type:complete